VQYIAVCFETEENSILGDSIGYIMYIDFCHILNVPLVTGNILFSFVSSLEVESRNASQHPHVIMMQVGPDKNGFAATDQPA
jgi:hypothetical protein